VLWKRTCPKTYCHGNENMLRGSCYGLGSRSTWSVCVSVCMCVRLHLCMFVRLHLYMCVRLHLCLCVRFHLCICVRLHLCICVRLHLCICVRDWWVLHFVKWRNDKNKSCRSWWVLQLLYSCHFQLKSFSVWKSGL
jgi:hypothetical protein